MKPDPSVLEATLPEPLRAALLRNHMASFVQAVFAELNPGQTLVWAPYLDLICALLEAVAHGHEKRLIITVPPRHLKSICVSVALPAFVLGHYPEQEVMNVTYGHDLTKKFAEDTLRVMTSAFFTDLFGQVLPRRRQSWGYLRTLSGGGRRGTSIEGVATGTGTDLLIFDDPQKPGEMLSDAVRRSTNEAFQTTFYSRLNKPAQARIVIVMQRLHEDDFVGHVQSNGEAWTVINLPAIADEDEAIPFECVLGKRVFRRNAGEALHPARTPLPVLENQRRVMGEAAWATQFQQRPAPIGGGLVKTAWFTRYRDDQLPAQFDRVVQSWDTANKIAAWNDYSVCTTWGVKGRHAYLLHVLRQRMEYPELKRAVVQQARLYDAAMVYVEDHASGTQIIQELRRENFGLIRPVKHTADKQTRMVNQTALIENGFIHIPEDRPWLQAYLDELSVFPNGKFDDQVDSTSQALQEIHSFSRGWGTFEFYRLENERRQEEQEVVYRLRPPPGMSMFTDIEGRPHHPHPDGAFHVTLRQAGRLVNAVGWTLEGVVTGA